MTSTRWALWLGTFGAGACIALGTAGTAAADTGNSDGSEGGDPSSQSSESNSTAPQSDAPAPSKDGAETDSETDVEPETETGTDSAPEPEAAPEPESEPAPELEAEPEPETEPAGDSESSVAQDNRPESAPTAPPPVENEPSAQFSPAAAQAIPPGVTGVKTSRAPLTIPVGPKGYTTRADWYLPTQSDGSVTATGVIWLQHGFLGSKASMSKLARTLSQQTNSIVVAPNISSFPLACSSCWINGVPMQQAVATMFLGDRTSLALSAQTAGYLGALPEDFVMSGHSAGGGFASAVGGYYAGDPGSDGDLRGVVMFDGFSFSGVVPKALESLSNPYIPVYQIAAPPQPWNSSGATTKELVAARPGQFVGVTLAGGSHVDSLIGGSPIFDFVAQLATGFSPSGNTDAVYTLATGWINDLYLGLGPADGAGVYGSPDQYLVLGDAAGVVLAPAPVVDLDRYLGTWYEVGSVKQFFSIGLVNTKAEYTLNPDGSVRVENTGNYFVNNGPESTIVGSALPVDPANNKLTVRFFGPPSADPPGNYWIVDLDADYQWAVVTDSTGRSGFLLTRDATVSADFYQELLDRASVNGVKGRITPTPQPAAAQETTTSV